ncbi:unnamed protein product [Bursaphelenchus okinawaensis]|uniref:Uncharacterized protein n=1 Tax=Bursaphelenchus okinawaensis TaxID=465554 RepID=A0A811LE81_9BILA|nr:unnamed protein product [Bursaphelenchus okinawaensis]CAG9120937.1 unnamed protein product [Bursaphelenchus okinawaensis]
MDDTWSTVFVAAVSENHFFELRSFVAKLRKYYKKSRLVVYDIGLSSNSISEIKSWCYVEYRYFNFSHYPEHVKHLANYSFKLVIVEALQSLNAFFYVDTSVSFKKNGHKHLVESVKSRLLQPFSTFPYTFHNVYVATHPQMYEYIPTPEVATKMTERVATAMFVVDSPYTRKIMKWWYLCAMTPSCISPPNATHICHTRRLRKRPNSYANCHRFDQSFWNLMYLNDLFGSSSFAITMGLTEPYTELNRSIVFEVNRGLKAKLEEVFRRSVRIRKGVKIKKSFVDKSCF